MTDSTIIHLIYEQNGDLPDELITESNDLVPGRNIKYFPDNTKLLKYISEEQSLDSEFDTTKLARLFVH